MQLLLRQWLESVEEDCGITKLETTQKGLIFLKKYFEIQHVMGAKSKQNPLCML